MIFVFLVFLEIYLIKNVIARSLCSQLDQICQTLSSLLQLVLPLSTSLNTHARTHKHTRCDQHTGDRLSLYLSRVQQFDLQSYMTAAPLCPTVCKVCPDVALCEPGPSGSYQNQEDRPSIIPVKRINDSKNNWQHKTSGGTLMKISYLTLCSRSRSKGAVRWLSRQKSYQWCKACRIRVPGRTCGVQVEPDGTAFTEDMRKQRTT